LRERAAFVILSLAFRALAFIFPAPMDWTNWTPRERANLCFILQNGHVLLIRKKRGLGAGKINAPGGRLEPNETALDAAIRETFEEVGVVPFNPEKRGELHFQFTDGYSLHCTVFVARGCEGEPVETPEATPIWTRADAIPYHEMWADDQHWLPLMLDEKAFRGYFAFDGESMLSYHVEIVEEGFRLAAG
jgi:8-oxo-dGTP diphosphatase